MVEPEIVGQPRVTSTFRRVMDGPDPLSSDSSALSVAAIRCRRVLNSHCRWTEEFVVTLANGCSGIGASPAGETISRFERTDRGAGQPKHLLETLTKRCRALSCPGVRTFDAELEELRQGLGANTSLALSLANLDAICRSCGQPAHAVLAREFGVTPASPPKLPRLLLNLLNGGKHAYTNPVLSDFHEVLLVPDDEDLEGVLAAFALVREAIVERLQAYPRRRVGKGWVHCMPRGGNRQWLDLVTAILDDLRLTRKFRIMIDAAAAGWSAGQAYDLSIAEHRRFSSKALADYWTALLRDYPIALLEDPFADLDIAGWQRLTADFPDRLIAGDDLCCTDSGRIATAAERGMISAVLIKPNQAGSVSRTVEAILASKQHGLVAIPSHRSIETETTVLSDLCFLFGARYVKLGLLSDFETILKLNRLLRYADDIPGKGGYAS